ncbi:hypothetical protein KR50_04870 [Jeotgalibacillus campisalis]|uniref:Uncharacterized protein n=1 Tax=Jeotgalibacillus campisalis TaxID=220754 RepID=A0A0C2WAT4_9BACL|nr:hypothetical protein KR50_04870 [Jeotgalibacillus campisalis]
MAKQAAVIIFEREPSLMDQFGEQGKTKCYEENVHHLKQLHSAYELKQTSFFIDYALWLNGILAKHGMNDQQLIDHFEVIKEVLTVSSQVEEEALPFYRAYLDQAILELAIQSGKKDR